MIEYHEKCTQQMRIQDMSNETGTCKVVGTAKIVETGAFIVKAVD